MIPWRELLEDRLEDTCEECARRRVAPHPARAELAIATAGGVHLLCRRCSDSGATVQTLLGISPAADALWDGVWANLAGVVVVHLQPFRRVLERERWIPVPEDGHPSALWSQGRPWAHLTDLERRNVQAAYPTWSVRELAAFAWGLRRPRPRPSVGPVDARIPATPSHACLHRPSAAALASSPPA